MKVLVVGLGSIGKRHALNLEGAGRLSHADVVFLRRAESRNPFGDEFLSGEHVSHPVVHSVAEAIECYQVGAVVVSNPTSFHIPVALEAARAGCHLLIEKPVSHSEEGLDELAEEVKKRKLVCMVAYHMHFHPGLKQIKRWLEEGRIGTPISVRAEVAERVTGWHPWEDYKISYATRHDLGGGVILTQSHEFDYLMWLLGRPEWVFASGGNKGKLGIDVEDAVESMFGFPGGVDVSLHMDYVKLPPKRDLEISGTKGRITCDLLTATASFVPLEKEPLVEVIAPPPGFDRNDMYADEIKHFFGCIASGLAPEVTLEDGRAALKVAFAVHESLKSCTVKEFTW